MKGRSQSKTCSDTAKKRTRLTLRDKRKVIALRKDGKTREEVQKLLNPKKKVYICKTQWTDIWNNKEAIMAANCSLKDFNTKHKATDNEIRKQFDSKVFLLNWRRILYKLWIYSPDSK